MKTFLNVTEQVTARNDPPKEFRVYEIDGHFVWARKDFADYLNNLQYRIQEFINSCPFMENLGDNQDYVMSFCQNTGVPKSCYGEWCIGCDDDDKGYCASPEENWRQ